MAEFMARVAGHNRQARGGTEPMTRERFDELVEEYGAASSSIKKAKA